MSRDKFNTRRNQIRRQKELKARCPSGKRRYKTLEQAELALQRIETSGDSRRSKVPQRAYACTFDGCGGFHLTARRVPLVSRTPIPPRSAKTAKVYRTTRVSLVVEILEERPWCEINWDENCTGRATTLHEVKKRSRGGSIIDRSNILTACTFCNGAVEDHPEEAHARGFAAHSWEEGEAS